MRKPPYPTLDQVKQADHTTLARWVRFLPSPGESFIGAPQHLEKSIYESLIMNQIIERFNCAASDQFGSFDLNK